MTEEELASKCKLADNQARKELYELYGGSLMAICLRYTGDREAAFTEAQSAGSTGSVDGAVA